MKLGPDSQLALHALSLGCHHFVALITILTIVLVVVVVIVVVVMIIMESVLVHVAVVVTTIGFTTTDCEITQTGSLPCCA